jgi:hypothetical protein
MLKAISILGLLTAIASATASQIGDMNPKAGVWVMVGGSVASAAGGALRKSGSSSPAVTALGLIVAVSGALAMATDVVPAKIAAIIAVAGTIASAAGQSLFGWTTEDKPVVGSNLRGNGFGVLLVFGLLGLALSTSGCPNQTQRMKAEEGVRKIYVGLQGASDAVDEVYRSKLRKLETARQEGSITADEFQVQKEAATRNALAGQEAIKRVATGVKIFKEEVRALPEITRDNKLQLLPFLDDLIGSIEKARQAGLLGISRDRVAEIEGFYTLLKGGVMTLQGVILAIKRPVPTAQMAALVQ